MGKRFQMNKTIATNCNTPTLPAKPPTVALALGGGGARGLAHILMLEAFEELGVRPKVIAGTSIGAIYGAAFASGLSAAHIRAHTEETLGQRLDLVRQLFSARAEPILKLFNLLPMTSRFRFTNSRTGAIASICCWERNEKESREPRSTLRKSKRASSSIKSPRAARMRSR